MRSSPTQPPTQPCKQMTCPPQQQPEGPSVHPQQETPKHDNPPPYPQSQVILQSPVSSAPHEAHYAGRTSHVLGAIQIAGGVLAIVFQVILSQIRVKTDGCGGAGYWCGIVCIVIGAVGATAGHYKKRCLISAYMVIAILGCVALLVFFICKLTILLEYSAEREMALHYYNHYADYAGEGDIGSHENSTVSTQPPSPSSPPPPLSSKDLEQMFEMGKFSSAHGRDIYKENIWSGPVALNSLLVLVGVVELVTLIWGSVLGCRAMCCGRGQQAMGFPSNYTHGQVFIATGNQHMQVVHVPQMASSTQPTEQKQPLPDTPPPAYA